MISQDDIFKSMIRKGWSLKPQTPKKPLPEAFRLRYGWLPQYVESFFENTGSLVSPDGKAWLLTAADIAGENGSAFAWNQWEIDTLASAEGDLKWQQSIHGFWDNHCPVLLSVKSCYAYFALKRQDMTIVHGEEPEYDYTTVVAKSFHELLNQIRIGDPQLARWI